MKIFPSTTVTWPTPEDAPTKEARIERAHVTQNGNRVVIRKRDDDGRYTVVDTILEAVWKGAGERASVTGKSHFMMDVVGVPYVDADVTVDIVARNKECLTC